MKDNLYQHFEKIYKDSDEEVICIDSEVKIVYLSKAIKFNFNLQSKDDFLLSAIIPTEFFLALKNSVNKQKSISFEFLSITENAIKKCFVSPVKYNDKRYASLFLITISPDARTHQLISEMKRNISELDENVRQFSSKVISCVRQNKVKLYKDLKENKALSSTLKIRKDVADLAIKFSKSINNKDYYLINLNQYLLRTETMIEEILGSDKVAFFNDFKKPLLLTEFSYENLDILISHAISIVIRKIPGKVNLIMRTQAFEKGNAIIIGASEFACNFLEASFEKSAISDDNFTSILSKGPLAKIVGSYGGTFLAAKHHEYGKAIGFILPPAPERAELLRNPPKDIALKQRVYSSLVTGLADVFDD